MDKGRKIILAVGGASGSIYARLLAERLISKSKAEAGYFSEIALITSKQSQEIAAYEDSTLWYDNDIFTRYDNSDFFSAPASGSACYDTMIVVPCSMGFIGRVAAGVADTLMLRAADVMLKERETLILVPRETPLSTIHIENLARLSGAGAVICPASPSFYQGAQSIEELCGTVVDRILKLAKIESPSYKWGENNKKL